MTPQQLAEESFNRHRHLLEGNGTTDELWAKAGEFTRRVAWDVRQFAGLIRKTGGRQCNQLDCDKVMLRTAPHQIFDIVVGAGAPGQHPALNYTGHDGSLDALVEPQPYPGAPPSPEPPQPPQPPVEPPTPPTQPLVIKCAVVEPNATLPVGTKIDIVVHLP